MVDGYDGATGSYTILVSTGCDPVTGVDFVHDAPVPLGQPVHFTATVTPLTTTVPITYAWDFGGAGAGSDTDTATPSFTYTARGTYTVVVTVSNPCGGPVASTPQVVGVVQSYSVYLPLVVRTYP